MGSWTGSGPILTGTCSTAAWTLFDLSTAYLWAPVIGCIADKPNCCPSSFVFASTATTTSSSSSASAPSSSSTSNLLLVTYTQTNPYTDPSSSQPTFPSTEIVTLITSDVSPVITLSVDPLLPVTAGPVGKRVVGAGHNGVPECPEDYVSVGSESTGCCPFGMDATQSPGLTVACASRLSTSFPAPELLSTDLPPAKPISTATDVIYALQYQVYMLEYQPPQTNGTGLSVGAKAGIGAGCGILALALIGAAVFFFRHKRQKRNKSTAAGVISVADEKPGGSVVSGPAELVAEDVKQRYELSNTQVQRVNDLATPIHECSPSQPVQEGPVQQSYPQPIMQGHPVSQTNQQFQTPSNQPSFLSWVGTEQHGQVYYSQQPVAYANPQGHDYH